MKARLLSLVFLLTLALLSACSGSSASPTATPSTGASTPVDAIKGFFTAVYNGDDPAPYVCSTPGVGDEFEVAARVSMGTVPGSSVDASGLTFTLKDSSADKATVTVSGQLVYVLATNKTPVDFPTSDVNVVKEGSFWKFCGGA